jgi:hypothetical protein
LGGASTEKERSGGRGKALKVKYQSLVFYDPDNEAMYTVYDGNLDFRKGLKGDWRVIGVCS